MEAYHTPLIIIHLAIYELRRRDILRNPSLRAPIPPKHLKNLSKTPLSRSYRLSKIKNILDIFLNIYNI